MAERRPGEAQNPLRRFQDANFRLDSRQRAALDRGRAGRLARLDLPLRKVQELPPQPWLRLTPARPAVAGKGYLMFNFPTFIGAVEGDLAGGYAWFEAAFDITAPGSTPLLDERITPWLNLKLLPVAPLYLIEVTVKAQLDHGGKPTFEVMAPEKQTYQVKNGEIDVITMAMPAKSAVFRLPIPGWTKQTAKDTGGSWVFYEAKVTPLG